MHVYKFFFFQSVQLRITVAEHIAHGKTPSLGHVIVGANTSGTELSHWNQMISAPTKTYIYVALFTEVT